MRKPISSRKERSLLQEFLEPLPPENKQKIGVDLEKFCQQYRDLGLGASFLTEAHSTKWLNVWKDYSSQEQDLAPLAPILRAAQSFTGSLFDRQIVDDDAFFYLNVQEFLSDRTATICLELNLQSSIRLFKKMTIAKIYKPSTAYAYVATLHDFNLFQATWPDRGSEFAGLESEDLLKAWVLTQIRRVDARNAGGRLGMVRGLLEFLKARHLIAKNPADSLRKMYPRLGWRGFAAALGSGDPAAALEKLKPPERFCSHLGPRMVEWVQLKRSLGVGFEFEERTLAQLDRFLIQEVGRSDTTPVSPQLLHSWLASLPGTNSRTRDIKRRVALHFFDYAIRRGDMASNPAHFRSAEVKRTLPPFIFAQEQIREVWRRANELRDVPLFLHRGLTFATVFAVLYCLGLRISEACRLSVEDIDLEQSLVCIRKSKFYKSRILPIGPKVRGLLERFVHIRRTMLGDQVLPQAPLFPSRNGRALSRKLVERVFRGIAKEMGLKAQPGHRGPCLHSFRHSFALHRLVRWYREGADVQAKLPLLSAYLGHVDIASTQVYLEANPELLEAANERFEALFGRPLLRNEVAA